MLAWAAALHAAMIRGTVEESQTSKLLSRAQVVLEPVPGTAGGAHSIRTDRNGGFAFLSLPAGSYVLKASRRGFMPMEYGQKRWNSAGAPVTVTEDGSLFLTIRLPRYSGIAGTIVDENYVGWLEGDVVAYRYAQPPVLVARGHSDERGVYRISGLEPGLYLVRSAAMQTEDASYLPTFSKEAVRAEESRPVEVYFEQDTTGVDVRPSEGRLFSLSGAAVTSPPCLPVSVTLASDMGRQTVQGPVFHFAGLAPNAYEIYADCPGAPHQAAYTALTLERDYSLNLQLQAVRETPLDVTPAPPGGFPALRLLARRKDLAGVGEPEVLHPANNRISLAPGRWELLLTPPPGYYVAAFSGGLPSRGEATRPDGWNEAGGAAYNSFRFALSSGPGSVHGVVKSSGEPVEGAPVYLEAYDPAAHHGPAHGTHRYARPVPFRWPCARRLPRPFHIRVPVARFRANGDGRRANRQRCAERRSGGGPGPVRDPLESAPVGGPIAQPRLSPGVSKRSAFY